MPSGGLITPGAIPGRCAPQPRPRNMPPPHPALLCLHAGRSCLPARSPSPLTSSRCVLHARPHKQNPKPVHHRCWPQAAGAASAPEPACRIVDCPPLHCPCHAMPYPRWQVDRMPPSPPPRPSPTRGACTRPSSPLLLPACRTTWSGQYHLFSAPVASAQVTLPRPLGVVLQYDESRKRATVGESGRAGRRVRGAASPPRPHHRITAQAAGRHGGVWRLRLQEAMPVAGWCRACLPATGHLPPCMSRGPSRPTRRLPPPPPPGPPFAPTSAPPLFATNQ